MTMRRSLLVMFLLISTSCVPSVQVMRTDNSIYPTKVPSDVQVFLDEPTMKFRTIALIEVSDDGWGMGLEVLKKSLTTEAAKIGGDAVIVSRQSKTKVGPVIPVGSTLYPTTSTDERLIGKVIVFVPDGD